MPRIESLLPRLPRPNLIPRLTAPYPDHPHLTIGSPPDQVSFAYAAAFPQTLQLPLHTSMTDEWRHSLSPYRPILGHGTSPLSPACPRKLSSARADESSDTSGAISHPASAFVETALQIKPIPESKRSTEYICPGPARIISEFRQHHHQVSFLPDPFQESAANPSRPLQ